jgi:hypothetical protein
MAYASIQQALEWFAEARGKSVTSHRKELLTKINDARRFIYSLNQRIRLDFHLEACFEAKTYYEPCVNCADAPATYVGITLPQEMEAVEAIWGGTTPMPIYNKWVEYDEGIKGRGDPLKAIDMGNDFPIQIEWSPCSCIKPVFMATSQADCGKEIVVSFKDSLNQHKTERLKLATTGTTTTSEVKSIDRPGGIVLPALESGVEVYDCIGGSYLGFYHPKTSIPAFRRMKITGVCCGQTVRVRASRKFTELEFNWEVIETDNKLALLEAMRYLDIMTVNSSDAQWLAKARMHAENVINFLGGDNLRNEGPTVVRRFDFLGGMTRRSKLMSRRRA